MSESFVRQRRGISGTRPANCLCEIIDTMSKLIGIDTQLFGLLEPVTELDIAEAAFAAEFHGELDALSVDLRTGKDVGRCVERWEAVAAFSAYEQGITRRPGSPPASLVFARHVRLQEVGAHGATLILPWRWDGFG